MQLLMTAFVAVLFFALTPGILVTLPPKGSKVIVALTHAIVFAVIYSITCKTVYSYLYEGFAPEGKGKNVTGVGQNRVNPVTEHP